jgi:hypothetical protein
MRLHCLKQEKRKKNCFKFKLAPESKMDAEICFRHIPSLQNFVFFKTLFCIPFFYYYFTFIEINFFKNSKCRRNFRCIPRFFFNRNTEKEERKKTF